MAYINDVVSEFKCRKRIWTRESASPISLKLNVFDSSVRQSSFQDSLSTR